MFLLNGSKLVDPSVLLFTKVILLSFSGKYFGLK